MNQHIQRLYQQIADLEKQLAQACADYSELHYLISPFLARLQRDVMPYHEKLVAVQRENADLRVMLGQRHAIDAQTSQSPVTRLLDVNSLSVTEQYKKAWARTDDHNAPTQDLQQAASPELIELYTELIPKVYPAFGQTAEAVEHRLELFKRANFAFAKRDDKTLRAMLRSFAQKETTLPAVVDPNMADDLQERVIMLEKAITQMEGQVFELRYGDIAKLKEADVKAKAQGRDLLKELKTELKRTLREAVQERDHLRKKAHN